MVKRFILKLLLKTKRFSSLAPYLVKITGKSKEIIHPKHLIKGRKPWYISVVKKNFSVLDIGSGNGQYTIKTAKYCRKIIGIENNVNQLNIGEREKGRLKIKNIQFIKADAEEKLKFDDKTFNLVLLLDVLEHLKKRKQLLKEIFRVLKKEGKLVLSVPNVNTSWKKLLRENGLPYYSDPDHKIEYDKKSIKKELEENGFKITWIKPIIYDYPLVGMIDLLGAFSLSLYEKITRWREEKVIKHPKESTGFRIICQKK